jgi:hypothetical protein
VESGTGGITWNNKPQLGVSLGAATVNSTDSIRYEIDVTSHVLAQLASGSNIVSFALTNPVSSAETILVSSREASSARPCLSFAITNYLPSVGIVSPAQQAFFEPPASIPISVVASTPSGTISEVELFANGGSIALLSTAPYSTVWGGVPSGSYSLTARVTDTRGVMATSGIVTVFVDAPPSVALTSPVNGATFVVPTNLLLTAEATDADGSVAYGISPRH